MLINLFPIKTPLFIVMSPDCIGIQSEALTWGILPGGRKSMIVFSGILVWGDAMKKPLSAERNCEISLSIQLAEYLSFQLTFCIV